jgi:hypothetical protein
VLAADVDGAIGAVDWDLRKAIASGSFAGNETVSLILSAGFPQACWPLVTQASTRGIATH